MREAERGQGTMPVSTKKTGQTHKSWDTGTVLTKS